MRPETPSQSGAAPVIVDEESVIPESIVAACQEAHKGGLLVSSNYENYLASMSEYSKPQTYAYGYGAATRPDQAPGYPPYGQQSYGISYSSSHAQVPSGLPNAAEIPLLSEDSYQAHDSNYAHQNASYSSFMPAGSRTAPEVTSFQPTQGPAGRKLFIYLNSNEDLEATGASFTVTFGSKRCEGLLTRLSNQSQQSNFALSVDVPPFDTTGSTPTQVSLYLEMADNRNPNMSMPYEFGQYTYTDATPYLSSPSLRKRKTSEEAHSPSKRPSSLNLRDSPLNNHEAKISPPMVESYSSRPQTAASNISYARTFNTPAHYSQSMQQAPAYRMAPAPVGMPQPQPFNSYPSYMPNDRAGVAPQGSMVSNGSSNPPLVRTSALQGGSPPGLSPSFNPYGAYPPNMKAVLKLEGDLNSMTANWTPDEVNVRRRIIRFRRAQHGSSISASFEPVTLEEHAQAPGCIYVNCIWWEEKQACFITSVDTIQLLESLVAVRFTVEEKNRIRRNLEGFRPLTVSKTRQDCEEFFKIIMGFPSPKPRNIEKDVKVFPWRILSVALKKIIGKYSASYSSTAAPLPSPVGAPPRHQLHSSSPPSATSSTAPMTYPSSMTATSMPTHQSNVSAGISHMSGGLSAVMHHQQSQQLHHPHQQQQTQPQSQPQQQQHQQQQQQQQQHQQPPLPQASQISSWHQPSSNYTTDLGSLSRGSWDFSQYIETTSPPGQGQGVPHYPQRIPSISAQLGFPFMDTQAWKDYTQRTTQA